jgi:hypothetical protein
MGVWRVSLSICLGSGQLTCQQKSLKEKKKTATKNTANGNQKE